MEKKNINVHIRYALVGTKQLEIFNLSEDLILSRSPMKTFPQTVIFTQTFTQNLNVNIQL